MISEGQPTENRPAHFTQVHQPTECRWIVGSSELTQDDGDGGGAETSLAQRTRIPGRTFDHFLVSTSIWNHVWESRILRMTQGSVINEFLSPLASHIVPTERLWPHHRRENHRSRLNIRGLSRSTDKLEVTKTGSRGMTAPRVERWETCDNEIAQPSKRCQDNASKFLVSLHEHTQGSQDANTLQFQRNFNITLPPRRCWWRVKPATCAKWDRDFSLHKTTAYVVGLQDSSNFALHFVPSETATSWSCRTWRALPPQSPTTVCGSSEFVTSTQLWQVDTIRQTLLLKTPFNTVSTARSSHVKDVTHTEKRSEVQQPQESHAAHGHNMTSLPTRRDTLSLLPLPPCPPRL